MIRIVLDGLVKRYDRVPVIDHLELEIHPGESTFLLGPAGAGKTTLGRLIAGLEQPDEGEIYFDGRPMREVATPQRRVGLVFQRDTLWPHLSVAENVGYALKIRGVSRRERAQRVDEALSLMRIDGLAERRPASLEAAQRRRVALARAIALDPQVLILDEPSAGLAGRALDEFHEDLRRVHLELDVTALYLTSDPPEALALADRLAVIDLGRIVQVGTPFEVYHRPADTFVSQFLGPANLLQGQLESTDARGGAVVRTPIGRLVGLAPPIALPSGSPVTVSIRPEALGLGGSTVPHGANRFPATVERQIFQGGVRHVQLRATGNWPLSALTLQSTTPDLREGQSLSVSVAPEAVVILPSRLAAADA